MTDPSRAWPFQEAAKLLDRFAGGPPKSGSVVFETGYGPSGLPHLGTFGEVARTAMVRHAFTQISDLPTRLICFSDDLDGMRKIPDNVPNPQMLAEYLGRPLTAVPDPFGTHTSFGEHNNARLRTFLDGFGFEYEFLSATECYRSGRFDAALKAALEHYDEIMAVMLPTLGPERRQSYSPFLPISPKTGKVLYVPMQKIDAAAGTITFLDEDGEETTLPVAGGHCKLQWKPDFGMRWAALGVDFEMYGKDHLVNGKLYSAICKILGGKPPEQFNYELFLDEKGEKISKSKGNGVTIEEWLSYGPQESLALYMYQSPKKAKRLHFDVIPKAVDEYLTFLQKYPAQDDAAQKENPVWHIHHGAPPAPEAPIGFGLLLNLASVCNPENTSVLWAYISPYAGGATPESAPFLDRLTEYAVRYYHDFVKPAKSYREPSAAERAALFDLGGRLKHLDPASDAEAIQTAVYEIGTQHGFEPLRAWFSCLYEVLLGQSQGPRMGSFFALYGLENSVRLIEDALGGKLMAA